MIKFRLLGEKKDNLISKLMKNNYIYFLIYSLSFLVALGIVGVIAPSLVNRKSTLLLVLGIVVGLIGAFLAFHSLKKIIINYFNIEGEKDEKD